MLHRPTHQAPSTLTQEMGSGPAGAAAAAAAYEGQEAMLRCCLAS